MKLHKLGTTPPLTPAVVVQHQDTCHTPTVRLTVRRSASSGLVALGECYQCRYLTASRAMAAGRADGDVVVVTADAAPAPDRIDAPHLEPRNYGREPRDPQEREHEELLNRLRRDLGIATVGEGHVRHGHRRERAA